MDTNENPIEPSDSQGEVHPVEVNEPVLTPVQCANCGAHFEFPTGGISSFGFDCTNCGAHSHVQLEQ